MEEYEPFETFERRLATLRVIDKIDCVNAPKETDFATVEGWRCEVLRGKHQVGELVVYIEIDSFVVTGQALFPIFDELEPKMCFAGEEGHLVETRCTGKGTREVSQGLIYALEDIPATAIAVAAARRLYRLTSETELVKMLRGWDLTDFLGIRKYDPPPAPPTPAIDEVDVWDCKFPAYLRRPKMERVQNCPNFFIKAKYRTHRYQESIKLDGASMTCYFLQCGSKQFKSLPPLPDDGSWFLQSANARSDPIPREAYDCKGGRFGICSLNRNISPLVATAGCGADYWAAALQDKIPQKMAKLGGNLALQGEVIGWNINGNRHHYPPNKTQFYVFAIWDIDRQRHWKPAVTRAEVAKLGLKHVPVRREQVRIPEICPRRKPGNVEFLELADKLEGEGLVYKCVEDGRWFKVVSNRYLLKHGIERVE